MTLAHAQFDRNVTWGFSTNGRWKSANNLGSDLLLHQRLSAGAFERYGGIFLPYKGFYSQNNGLSRLSEAICVACLQESLNINKLT